MKNNLSKNTIAILLFLMFTPIFVHAQKQVTLKEAIEIALTNHPNLKAANLEVERSTMLQNLKYNLGPTEISYQGDGLFDNAFGQQVNQIGFVQNIENPHTLRSKNNFQSELTTQNLINQQQTKNELIWNVKQLYLEIQHRNELLKLYTEFTETYTNYYKKAAARVEAGEANSMESLLLNNKRQEYVLLIKQIKIESENLNKKLSILIKSDELIQVSETLSTISYNNFTQLDSTLILKLNKQNIAMETAKVQLLNSELKPDYILGYSAQNYKEGGWLNAVQAGISIPIFKSQTKKKIEAQKVKIEIAKYQYESKKLELQQQLIEAENNIRMLTEGASFYKEQLNTIHPEIIRISELNYQSGEISYLELLNALQLMATTSKNYLNQIAALNKNIADYQFLTNQ